MTSTPNHIPSFDGRARAPLSLQEVDARIDAAPSAGTSLRPGGGRATRLIDLVPALCERSALPSDQREVFTAVASQVAYAQVEAFPNNLFWDFDSILASVLSDAMNQRDSAEALRGAGDSLAELMAMFGVHTPIRFRYVHDFMYGFDWAAWVRRDPSRKSTGPFHVDYVQRTLGRGRELLALIEANDAEYPQVPPDTFRNPFEFRRTAEDELRLFQDLAERDLIPVRGWLVDDTPRWDQPFGALRTERAEALGIPHASE